VCFLAGAVSTIADINYESLTTHSFALPISLSDGRANLSAILTIDVIDVNEVLVWSSAIYRTQVNEGVVSIVTVYKTIGVCSSETMSD